MSEPAALYEALREEVSTVLVGKHDVVEEIVVALLTRGHVLLEGVPGVAKTTAANLAAQALGLDHARVQMTPDLLPADVTGTHVYREASGEFELQRGPVFANLVVVDEINRATPKTQSALLEAMQERRVTIEGETLDLPEPFLVVATQNPIEMEGTFELPQAQRNRFQLKVTVDLPTATEERELLDRFDDQPALDETAVERVVTRGDILDARDEVAGVHVADPLKEYVLDLVTASREHEAVSVGGSPRATLAFLQTAKARAAIHGRDYAIPDDVKRLARPVLAHRLVLEADAELGGVTPDEVVEEILDRVEPPGSADLEPPTSNVEASDGGESG